MFHSHLVMVNMLFQIVLQSDKKENLGENAEYLKRLLFEKRSNVRAHFTLENTQWLHSIATNIELTHTQTHTYTLGWFVNRAHLVLRPIDPL